MVNWKRVADIVAALVIAGCAIALFSMLRAGDFAHKPVAEQQKLAMQQQHKLATPEKRQPPKTVAGEKPMVHAPTKKPPVYKRVLPGGNTDGPMTCTRLKSLTGGVPESVIEQYAHEYGISASAVRALKECYR